MFSLVCNLLKKPQFPVDLVKFTEKIGYGKLHFLCSASFSIYSYGNFNGPKHPFNVVLQNNCSESFLKIHGRKLTMETLLVKLQTQTCYKNISITIAFLSKNFQNNLFIEHIQATISAT